MWAQYIIRNRNFPEREEMNICSHFPSSCSLEFRHDGSAWAATLHHGGGDEHLLRMEGPWPWEAQSELNYSLYLIDKNIFLFCLSHYYFGFSVSNTQMLILNNTLPLHIPRIELAPLNDGSTFNMFKCQHSVSQLKNEIANLAEDAIFSWNGWNRCWKIT